MKMLKRISLVSLILFISLFVCGCKKEEVDNNLSDMPTVKKDIVSKDFDMNGTGTLSCKQDAATSDEITADLSYELKYESGNILELVSIQKITSSSKSMLDLYEESYSSIASNYKGLKYYDTEIVRDNNFIIYTMTINYDKIDIDQLLAIEGAEDNIIQGNKAKLSLWLDLASQVGTLCEEV